ncbi:MAG: ABC transporter ATP-binding protein [Jatrophihabitans sp.]|nr:MAG: ABC transporter ATP-binding protein [Jatrophihabitans sp.]
MNVIETEHLGKRYRRTWALRDCSLAVPAGRVTALVGPNGAGKSTLLNIAVGLTRPTAGTIRVLDGLVPGSPEALRRIAFVAQDSPLYASLSVAETLHLVAALSDRFDAAEARRRLAALEIPLRRRVGRLSGGQHAQVALAVALSRRPDLLVLDEPVARLDPLARHEFMATLMAAVADGLAVLLSSHVVAELERVCDHLVVLGSGAVQVTGEVDELLGSHRLLTGPAGEADRIRDRFAVVGEQVAGRQARLLVRRGPHPVPPLWQEEPTNLEELVLGYLRAPGSRALPGPERLAS